VVFLINRVFDICLDKNETPFWADESVDAYKLCISAKTRSFRRIKLQMHWPRAAGFPQDPQDTPESLGSPGFQLRASFSRTGATASGENLRASAFA